VGGALIFSGRPNPTWRVAGTLVKELKKIWDSLEPVPGPRSSAPPLGYRGCFLKWKPDQEWHAYRGVVTLKSAAGLEYRRDRDREFEKLLLASAPTGVIPPPEQLF
jgi:hypothetical protein